MAQVLTQGDDGCPVALANGTNGQVLTLVGGTPAWAAGDDQTAAEVAVTPFATIEATNVQAALVEIVAECCIDNAAEVPITPLNGNITATPTNVQAALEVIDNWAKVVTNPGSTAPLADVADAGAQPLVDGTTAFRVAETNDIIPTIGADGVMRWYFRPIGARVFLQNNVAPVPQLAFTTVTHGIVQYNDPGLTYVAGVFTVAVAGDYLLVALVSWATGQTWISDPGGNPVGFTTAIAAFINGVGGPSINEEDHYALNQPAPVFRNYGSVVLRLNAGDTVEVRALHFQPIPKLLEQNEAANSVSLTRLN